jgi:hypothetical protein
MHTASINNNTQHTVAQQYKAAVQHLCFLLLHALLLLCPAGNYCQPRCDEPWTEVLFESSQEGKIVVIVSPLIKLTRVKGAAIDDIGTPEGILNRWECCLQGFVRDWCMLTCTNVGAVLVHSGARSLLWCVSSLCRGSEWCSTTMYCNTLQ